MTKKSMRTSHDILFPSHFVIFILVLLVGGVFHAVPVRAADEVAQFVSQNVPDKMVAGQKYYPNITLKNTGTSSWTSGSAYRLGSQSPQDNTAWGTSRFNLKSTETVAPGQSKTFTMPITAPAIPGTYLFQWRMVHELVGWFGDFSPSVTVRVAPPGPVNLRPYGDFISDATNAVTLSWDAAPNAVSYSVRVVDESEPALRDPRNTCSGYYLCTDSLAAVSISLPVKPGHFYTWSVESKIASGSKSLNENAYFAVQRTAALVGTEKIVGAYVAHNYRNRGTTKLGFSGAFQGVWQPLEGRDAWDGSVGHWKKLTRDIIDSGSNAILFDVARTWWDEEMTNHLLAVKQLATEGYGSVKIAPLFHPPSWNMAATDPPLNLMIDSGKDTFYQAIKRWFTLYFTTLSNESLVQVNGKVLVMLWTIPGCSSAPSDILVYLNDRLQQDFGFTAFWSTSNCWAKYQPDEVNFLFAGIKTVKFGNRANVTLRPGGWPPYETLYRPNSFVPRANGTTYSNAWATALQQKSKIERIYLTTWNELPEGNALFEAQMTTHTEVGDPHPSEYAGPYSVDFNSCWGVPCHPIPHNDSWGSDPRLYINITKQNAVQFLPPSPTPTPTPSPAPIPTPSPSPTPTPTPISYPISYPTPITKRLYRGLRDPQVKALQQFLIKKGYLAAEFDTGYFGVLTYGAVKKFQCDNSIICSGTESSTGYGVVGPKTRAIINGM